MIKELVIYSSLLIYLVVGIISKIKVKSFKDFAIGEKPYSKLSLVGTMVASMIGTGSIIGGVEQAYKTNLMFLLSFAFLPIGAKLTSIYIVPRFKQYYGHYTLAKMLGTMYGMSIVQYVAALSSVLLIGTLGMQVKGLAAIFEGILGYNNYLITIVAFLTIAFYSSMGGIRAVIRTDVLQFFLFIFIIPCIVLGLLKEYGGSVSLLASKVPTSASIDKVTIFSTFSLALFFLLPDDSPDFAHRLLIGRNIEKNRIALNILSLVNSLIIVMILIIAGIALVYFPEVSPDQAMLVVIKSYLKSDVLYGVFGAALVAIVLSTADSLLNTLSIVMVDNFLPSKIASKKKIYYGRLVTIISSIFALYIAFKSEGIFTILLFFGQLYSSAIFVPYILGLFIENKSPVMFWSSSLSGVITYLALKIKYPELEDAVFLISMSTSIIIYFLILKLNVSFKDINKSFKNKCRIINQELSQENILVNYIGYASLPISLLIIFFPRENNSLELYYIELSMMIIAILSSFSKILLEKFSLYRNIFNHLAIWYCFPFFSALLYILNYNSNIVIFHFITTIIVLVIMYQWDKMILNLMSAYFAVLITSPAIINNRFHYIENYVYLGVIISYVSMLTYFLLRKKQNFSKEVVENVIHDLSNKKEEEIKFALQEYDRSMKMVNKHNKIKKLYINIRSKTADIVSNGKLSILRINKINKDIKNYFSLIAYKNKQILNIIQKPNKQSLNQLYLNVELLYLVVFGISNFVVETMAQKINITLSMEGDKVFFLFELDELKFPLEEIARYSRIESEDFFSIDTILAMGKNSNLIESIIMRDKKLELVIKGENSLSAIKTENTSETLN